MNRKTAETQKKENLERSLCYCMSIW